MSNIEKLRGILHLHNTDKAGVDSTKRALAIELIAGPPDNWQTDRLCEVALALAKARGDK